MESGKPILDIEQTFYGKMFMQQREVIVTTISGWTSEKGTILCEERQPGGVWCKTDEVDKEGKKVRVFVPFSAIDHVKVFE